MDRIAQMGLRYTQLRPTSSFATNCKQAIKDWYDDPGYRPLIAKRHAAARSFMIAVEGE